ncbi:MAG: N-formylglutamate amidohydrolase [Mameliella sp.]|nr:N-formylglutamate amidohydrolase [Mameliella sp.]
MLFSENDPAPVLSHGVSDGGGILLTCEHAGHAVPSALGDLGVPQADLRDHIGWDPGALAVAQVLADRLQTRLVAQRYSRLVIDCNRPRSAPDLIPEVSDTRAVPGNVALSVEDRDRRWHLTHQPFHAEVAHQRAHHRALLSIHSFTPQKRDGAPRATQIGVLARDGNRLFTHLMTELPTLWPGQVVANDPYEIEDDSDYTIPVHAERHGLPHALLEIRNDLIADAAGVIRMAEALSAALKGYRL